MDERNKAINLLIMLGVKNYTERHLRIIIDFLEAEQSDVKKLLDELGSWDADDLAKAEEWLKK